jgi:hypothetical protein
VSGIRKTAKLSGFLKTAPWGTKNEGLRADRRLLGSDSWLAFAASDGGDDVRDTEESENSEYGDHCVREHGGLTART